MTNTGDKETNWGKLEEYVKEYLNVKESERGMVSNTGDLYGQCACGSNLTAAHLKTCPNRRDNEVSKGKIMELIKCPVCDGDGFTRPRTICDCGCNSGSTHICHLCRGEKVLLREGNALTIPEIKKKEPNDQ